MTGPAEPPHRAGVVFWDHKGQPDLDHLAHLVEQLSADGPLTVYHPGTDSDEHALIIATGPLGATPEEFFRRWFTSDDVTHIVDLP